MMMRIYPFEIPDYLKKWVDEFVRKETKFVECNIHDFDQVWEYILSKGVKEEQTSLWMDTPEDVVIEWIE